MSARIMIADYGASIEYAHTVKCRVYAIQRRWNRELEHICDSVEMDEARVIIGERNYMIRIYFRMLQLWCRMYHYGENPSINRPVPFHELFHEFLDLVDFVESFYDLKLPAPPRL